ncbi:MAG: catalase [Leptospirales bacterium]|nr:catalase [Leptospirales bacterium]
MKQPSTEWREIIAPDEETRYKGYVEFFKQLQEKKSKQYGNGRTLHRKQLLALSAELEILGNLPDYAKHGLFAKAAKYNTWIRLSNGGMDKRPDKEPDIRGFTIKVLGLSGPGALGNNVTSQDFLLINREVFGLKSSEPFVQIVMAISRGPLALLGYFIRTHGFFGGLKAIGEAKASVARKFTGFASEKFYSAAPLSCGPYAMRVRIVPSSKPNVETTDDWAKEMSDRVKQGPITFDMQLQFFVDESTTPIEDASVNWEEANAPYVTVGKLTIPQQDTHSEAGKKLDTEVESVAFDPWNALVQHKPLGDVMRARKFVYLGSQQGRKAISI